MSFRLRINFQKRGRLRLLSHLELVRAMERAIRRAQLPFVTSKGFNVHMRYAPGPALPVGTIGLDEYFDVWLTEYLDPNLACLRLRAASVEDLGILAVSYVDPRAKGLQATHTHEVYEIVLGTGPCDAVGVADALSVAEAVGALSAAEATDALARLIAGGSLTVKRKNKSKVYDLTQMVERMPEARSDPETGEILITLYLKANEQGSIRPEALMRAAFDNAVDQAWAVRSVTRTRLYED
jgi:radical SAM-linked protein